MGDKWPKPFLIVSRKKSFSIPKPRAAIYANVLQQSIFFRPHKFSVSSQFLKSEGITLFSESTNQRYLHVGSGIGSSGVTELFGGRNIAFYFA